MKKQFYIAFGISILVIALIFMIFNSNIFLNDEKDIKEDIGTGDLEEEEDEEENNIEEKKDELLFLILGVDSNDVDKYSGIRTDTIILSKINFKTGDMDLLSIPRDTRVKVRGKLDKINHAHSYDGVDLTLETVREFLDIELDYYVKINYDAVEKVVDAIGGIEIDVPRRMKYDDPVKGKELHIDIEKGVQILDGKKSLEFLRWRNNNDGTGYSDGDIGRIKAQQMFIKELIKQTVNIKNVFTIPKLIKTYYDYVDTNIHLGTMLKAGNMARKIDMENININTIPGEGAYVDGISYYIYEAGPTEELIESIFGDYMKKY